MPSTATKNAKYGRNKVWCTGYKLVNRKISNKIRKIQRHIKRLPGDLQAKRALRAITN